MLFLEIILSIYCLLFVSSWVMTGSWLANRPFFKLKLARLLLVSCVIAPILVHCIGITSKPKQHHYISVDTLQQIVNQPILKAQSRQVPSVSNSTTRIDVSYYHLLYILFALITLFRVYQLLLKLRSLKKLLADATPFKVTGRLIIKVSSQCHIPFSTLFLNKAYIVLPVSLFASTMNVKIAIAMKVNIIGMAIAFGPILLKPCVFSSGLTLA